MNTNTQTKPTQVGHTPGPWRNPLGSVSVFANHSDKVCDTTWSNKKVREAEANARLIAAAPELLGACKAALAQTSA